MLRFLLFNTLRKSLQIVVLSLMMLVFIGTPAFDRANVVSAATPPVPAFPGAEGFGANSVGGRGGRVIEVTNLNDSGAGSFRTAVEASGARIVIFRVGGTLTLESELIVSNPYITIAGQTAPGDGITIRTAPSNTKAALRIETHDAIVRYIRFRRGPSDIKTGSQDGFYISRSQNVILDHVSMSWGTDGVLDIGSGSQDVTIQWSIISEGLHCSSHDEGCHSTGTLLAGNVTNISLHHNLWAHDRTRAPRIEGGLIDFVNNVIYNLVGTPGKFMADSSATRNIEVNYVGNYFKLGPNSSEGNYAVSIKKCCPLDGTDFPRRQHYPATS